MKLLALAVLLGTGCAGAKADLLAAPPAGPAPLVEPIVEGDVAELWVHGLHVLVKTLPRQPVVSCELYIRGGVRNWSGATAGIEKLALGVAVSGGTETLSKAAFQARLAALGVQLVTESTEDDAVVGFKSLPRAFAESFELLADAFLHPLLPDAEIALQRSLMISELAQEEDDPDAALTKLSHAQLYAGLPYAERATGTRGSLATLQRADLAAHLDKLRETSRLLLVVVGNVAPAAVAPLVERVFAAVPAGDYREAPFVAPRFQAPRVQIVPRDLPTNYIMGAFPTPTFGSPELAAGVVAMSALHDRMFEQVRTKLQLSYAPSAGLVPHGLGQGYLYVSAVDATRTLAAMRRELAAYQSTPLSAEQLEGSKRVFLTSFLMQEESTSGMAELLARAQLVGGDWRLARDLPTQVAEVTPAQVREFLARHARNLQTVVLGTATKIPAAALEGSAL